MDDNRTNEPTPFADDLDRARAELVDGTPAPDRRVEELLLTGPSYVTAVDGPDVVSMDAHPVTRRRRARLAVGAVAASVAVLAGAAVVTTAGDSPVNDVATSAPAADAGTALGLVGDDDAGGADDADAADDRSSDEGAGVADSPREWFECVRDAFEERLSDLDVDGELRVAFDRGRFGGSVFVEGLFGHPPVALTFDDACGPPPIDPGEIAGVLCARIEGDDRTCLPHLPLDAEVFEECARSDEGRADPCFGFELPEPLRCVAEVDPSDPASIEACFGIPLGDLGADPLDLEAIVDCIDDGTSPLVCARIGLDLPADLTLPPFGRCADVENDPDTAGPVEHDDSSIFGTPGWPDWLPCPPFDLLDELGCDGDECPPFGLPGATVCDRDTGTCISARDLFEQFPGCLRDDSCELPGLVDIENCAPDEPERECWKIEVGHGPPTGPTDGDG